MATAPTPKMWKIVCDTNHSVSWELFMCPVLPQPPQAGFWALFPTSITASCW